MREVKHEKVIKKKLSFTTLTLDCIFHLSLQMEDIHAYWISLLALAELKLGIIIGL